MNKIRLVIICLAIVPILWLTSECIKAYNDQVAFRNATNEEIEKVFSDDLRNSRFEIDQPSNLLRFRVEVRDVFFDRPLIEQFTLMELTYQQMRYYMKYQEVPNAYYEKNMVIICENDKQSVLYENSDLGNIDRTQTNGSLVINQTKKITKDDILTDPAIMQSYQQDLTHNGFLEKDVMEYIEDFSNILTKRHKYYRFSEDDQLILEAVGDQFQLSMDEIKQIYKKHYLVFTHLRP